MTAPMTLAGLGIAEPDFPADTAIEKALFDTGFRRLMPPRRDGAWRVGEPDHDGVDDQVAIAALAPLEQRRYASASKPSTPKSKTGLART